MLVEENLSEDSWRPSHYIISEQRNVWTVYYPVTQKRGQVFWLGPTKTLGMQCPQEDRERWKVYDNDGPEYEVAGGLSESEAMIFDGIDNTLML